MVSIGPPHQPQDGVVNSTPLLYQTTLEAFHMWYICTPNTMYIHLLSTLVVTRYHKINIMFPCIASSSGPIAVFQCYTLGTLKNWAGHQGLGMRRCPWGNCQNPPPSLTYFLPPNYYVQTQHFLLQENLIKLVNFQDMSHHQ